MFGSSPTTPRAHDGPNSFAPKVSVLLDAPKDDPITYEELGKCDRTDLSKPVLIAVKGTVLDVSRKRAYQPGGSYHVFAGKDPSRTLAISSLKPEDYVPEWHDLEDVYKTVLSEWYTFLSKRYRIVGKVQGANNLWSQ